MTPTYYVQHPDGSYSVADPQPQQDTQSVRPEFIEFLKKRSEDSYSCSVLVRDAIAMLNAATTPPAQQEWIDDAGRLRWALWRIKDLEQQLSGRSAAIAPPSQSDDEHLLRLLLAVRVAGPGLYTDDGEMSDCSATPYIDFKRDGVKEIERKLIERGMAKAWGSIGELLATKTSADDQSDGGRS